MENFPWMLVVIGGPLVLAIAFAFALMKRRRLSPGEKMAQHEAIEDVYHPEGHRDPDFERPEKREMPKGSTVREPEPTNPR